jgi:uncharacterized protein YgbK (DUF1537 family)
MANILLGIVADDFTGASDAASFLVQEGIKTILFNGVPDRPLDHDGDDMAVVIALKTRTEEKRLAVTLSGRAFQWLKENGARQLYSKYCSTFDSTREGNIGPIIDHVLETHGYAYTIVAPALPVNGRTVKDGHLLVHGVPLHHTHMKDHPLTPMWDSDLAELLKPQGKYPSLKITHDMLELAKEDILQIVRDFGKDHEHFYVIPDYCDERHANKIVEVFGDLPFMTGGSGLMGELGKKLRALSAPSGMVESGTEGKAIILAGSCSVATLRQIETYGARSGKSIKIDPIRLADGSQTKEQIWQQIEAAGEESVLVYSSDKPENVKFAQQSVENAAHMLEQTMAWLARNAEKNGYSRIIVAGGETSGAVTQALGYNAYLIGQSIAPGVPIMVPLENRRLRLVLKSGNFGQEDFFLRAIDMTGG